MCGSLETSSAKPYRRKEPKPQAYENIDVELSKYEGHIQIQWLVLEHRSLKVGEMIWDSKNANFLSFGGCGTMKISNSCGSLERASVKTNIGIPLKPKDL